MSKVTVAAVQMKMRCQPEDNIFTAENLTRQAAARGAKIALSRSQYFAISIPAAESSSHCFR